MLLDAAAALLLLCAVSAGTVPPPTDVTVNCPNLKTTVSWNHREKSQTRFLVNVVGSDAKHHEIVTSAHEVDVTHFLWESMESCMDNHYVTVTAMRDGNQSVAFASTSFSFNQLKTSSLKCLLEFPPIELMGDVGESGATVVFKNPLSFYKELERVAKQDDGVSFKYTVNTQSKKFGASCSKEDDFCRCDISFPVDAEPYVTLEGKLCNRDCLGEVAFNKTTIVLDQKDSTMALTITLTLMLGIFLFVAVVITVFICKVRGWTMDKKDPQTPRALVFEDEEKQTIFARGGTKEHALPVTAVIPDCPITRTDGSEDDDLHQCRNASFSSEEGYRNGGLSEDSNQSSGCGASGSDQTERLSMSSEDDECARGYDRPQRLLDMGDGDMVTSYSNR